MVKKLMARRNGEAFWCEVVNEEVLIHLRNRRVGGFNGREKPFVQCDQCDCQYVDNNVPPCPLSLGMFAGEIEKREERKRERLAWG
jgi:hypothetical protein